MEDIKKIIRKKNDLFRKTFIGGKVLMTKAVSESPDLEKILIAVREFNDFNKDNDPHLEHDAAIFTVEGQRYMFKIDYFDNDYMYFKEDGNRVLTIMFANEY